jgi:nitroreductase
MAREPPANAVFEAGAASQNLALQAVAQGLGAVVVGAFDDAAVAAVLQLGPGERPIALMPLGIPGWARHSCLEGSHERLEPVPPRHRVGRRECVGA